jgi:hypothetical protein
VKQTSLLLLRIGLFITLSSAILLLAACGGEEVVLPTPIFPPPVNLNETATALEGEPEQESTTMTMSETAVSTSEAINEPESTATPTLEPTPTLLPTATPVTNPPMHSLSVNNLPSITRDLVFLTDGSLKMWNHNSGQIETLYASNANRSEPRLTPFTQRAGDITQFSVSTDGNRIAAARLTQTTMISDTVAESVISAPLMYNVYELLFLDVVSRESWTLAESVSNLGDFAISPNQKNVAFTATSLIAAVEPDSGDVNLPSQVYVVSTPDGGTRQVGSCPGLCFSISWHPNSDLFTWSDNNALWLFNLSGSTPEQLIANDTSSPATSRFYRAKSWAGNGRYLLLWEQASEGAAKVVFDIPTRTLIPIPETFTYAEPFPTEVLWMRDDRLLILRSPVGAIQFATLEIWRVALDEGVVIQEEVSRLAEQAAAGAIHLENGRFAYALLDVSDANSSGIYLQTSLSELPERVNGLIPTFIAPDVIWSPDGTSAIIRQNGYVLLVPTSGDVLYDGTAVFGSQTQIFVWLPPGTVSR